MHVLSLIFRQLFLKGLAALDQASRLAFFCGLAPLTEEKATPSTPSSREQRRTESVRLRPAQPVNRPPARFSPIFARLTPTHSPCSNYRLIVTRARGRHLQMEETTGSKAADRYDHDLRRRRVSSPAFSCTYLPSTSAPHPAIAMDGLLADRFRRSDTLSSARVIVSRLWRHRPLGLMILDRFPSSLSLQRALGSWRKSVVLDFVATMSFVASLHSPNPFETETSSAQKNCFSLAGFRLKTDSEGST